MMSYNYSALYSGFLVLNILIALWRIRAAALHKETSRGERGSRAFEWYNPAYVDPNSPMVLPLPYVSPVAMTLHETTRFGLNATDEAGDMDWETIMHWADGYGRVRIGPDRRVHVVSYYHQLHCLRGMQRGIAHPERTDSVVGTPGHLQHCFNYLRQTLLCMATAALEKGDFMYLQSEEGTMTSDLVCQDWEVLIDGMQDNYEEFQAWNTKWN